MLEVDEFEVSATEVMMVVPDVEVRLMLESETRELPLIRLLFVEVMLRSPEEVRLLAMLDDLID